MAYGSFRTWWQVVRQNGMDARFLPKAAFVTVNSVLFSPFRLLERRIHQPRVHSTPIKEPPVFILGHWRSGTTYLHYLLAQDDSYGYMSFYQTVAPEMLFIGQNTIKHFIEGVAPDRRPGDKMLTPVSGPQEDEYAIVNQTPHSMYHYMSFPRQQRYYVDRYCVLDGIPPDAYNALKETYRNTLRATSRLADEKPLLIKNPANTGRISMLLKLFPDAKFIHIHRNPYDVFFSTFNFFKQTHKVTALQTIDDETLKENILYTYRRMYQKLFEDISLIPEGHFAEVRYDDLNADALPEVQQLYETLNLGDFERVRPAICAEVEARASHTGNRYTYDDTATIESIQQEWGFTIERWQYDLPE
jgi:hypothetical protein